jgi:hypothetical protein
LEEAWEIKNLFKKKILIFLPHKAKNISKIAPLAIFAWSFSSLVYPKQKKHK